MTANRSARPTRFRLLHGTLPLFLLLSPLVLLAACLGKDGGDSAAADSAAADTTATAAAAEGEATERQERAIRVMAGPVIRGDLVQSVFADGELRTLRLLEIKAKIGGQLVEVLVRDGDQVRQGQLLARLDGREHRLELEKSRYDQLRALSQVAAEQDTYDVDLEALREFEQQRRELERQRDRGRLSPAEFRTRLLELEMTALAAGAFRQEVFQQRTGLADARLAEERARLNLEYTEIRAPFNGVVQGTQAVEGANIQAGQTICFLYDNEHLEAAVNVLEANLADLAPGRPARVAVPALRDTILGRVDVIAANLDPASRTCEILVRFENASGRFRPGMFCRAEIAGFVHPQRLMVPKAAILVRDDRPLVFKHQDGRAQWLYVTTGLQNDHWVEIVQVHSGGTLDVGDEVIVSDHLTLAHESMIELRGRATPDDRWAFARTGGSDGR
ncbi:MAG: efflux RND transporter periplasmic adaptor subunit [Candidatus Krumholzibacteria bacterium]|jgi:membrane fusion protein (multidrug efflux system)|nr:efflux RND transporter periplasmic adaptor subunit [Candidatus Krumholzibacteria bacterium]